MPYFHSVVYCCFVETRTTKSWKCIC